MNQGRAPPPLNNNRQMKEIDVPMLLKSNERIIKSILANNYIFIFYERLLNNWRNMNSLVS